MPSVLRLVLPPALVATALAFGSLGGGAAAPDAARAQQSGPSDDPTKPLVYVFSLDAQDGDRAIDQGLAPFVSRLVRGEEGGRASYYRESRGIMVSETNPNHTAMATGAYGSTSGISGNTFAVYDAASQRDCPADGGSTDPFGGGAEPPKAGTAVVTSGEAASCLRAETFFAALKRTAPDVVTAGIFGKPKLARIFSTKTVDPNAFDADHLYAPCEQSSDDPDYCKNDPVDPVQRYTQDNFVMDEVIRTVDRGVQADGALRRPNLTFANFPQIDQTGHASGAREAYETMIARADEQIKRFVDNQKRLGLWGRTVMVITSDHSMDSTTPNFQTNSLERAFGADASRVEVVLNGSVDMVFLKDRNAPDRDALLKRLRAAALANGAVDEALYRMPNPADGADAHTLDAVHPGWNIAGERTGDLLVTSKVMSSFGEPSNPLMGNHGAPTTLDHTFAIISGGDQVVQQAIAGRQAARFDDTLLNPGQAEQVDIAPTVMALFGRRPPANNQGRVLTEAFRQGALPPVTDPGSAPGSPLTGPAGGAQSGARSCDLKSGFASLRVGTRGRGLQFAFARRTTAPARVDLFRQSTGRRVLGNRRVKRFTRTRSFSWSGRGAQVGDGLYFVRVSVRLPGGGSDARRFALRRENGRFRLRPAFERPASCGLLRSFKLERTALGGRSNRALSVSFRLDRSARVNVDVLRRGRVVRRFPVRTREARILHRLRLASEGLGRGDVLVRLTAVGPGGERVVARLTARRL